MSTGMDMKLRCMDSNTIEAHSKNIKKTKYASQLISTYDYTTILKVAFKFLFYYISAHIHFYLVKIRDSVFLLREKENL